MRSSRSKNRARTVGAVLAATLVVAGSATAAEPAETTSANVAIHDKAGRALERVANWAARTHRNERREAAGPFLPIVGPIDFGTAENAFGASRSGHVHAGQDMFASPGTPEVAVTDAVVAETGSDGGQGNYVYLYDRKRDRTYVYMHMIEPAKVRQRRGRARRPGARRGRLHRVLLGRSSALRGPRRPRVSRERPRDPMPLLRDWQPLDRPR